MSGKLDIVIGMTTTLHRTRSYARSVQSTRDFTLHDAHSIIYYPSLVHFNNIRQNRQFSNVLSVQNISKVLKKIRILGTTTHKSLFSFHISHEYIDVAPGCAVDVPIVFYSRKQIIHTIHTQLRIGIRDHVNTDDNIILIPIIADTPQASVDFENLIDFGSLVVDETYTREVVFHNKFSPLQY